MRTSVRSGALALCFALLALGARADEVTLKNGGAIRGRILSEDERQVVIETDAGPVTIARARIKDVQRSATPPPARTPAPDAPGAQPAAEARTLLLFGFDGADARLVQSVAQRLRTLLRVNVEVLADRPKPDERDLIDHRAQVLPGFARQLKVDPTGTPAELERRLRAALAQDQRAEARRAEALLDDACRPRLVASRLSAQAAEVAGERMRGEGVLGVIGVTHRDLATPDLNFVFGSANRITHSGVVSYVRFDAPDVRRDVLVQRLAIQVLSSTGGMLGLEACKEPTCARAFPNNLAEHDLKRAYCSACQAKVDAALGR